MPLRPTTIRFAENAYAGLQHEADEQGVSLAQYVREAALIRYVIDTHDRAEGEAVSMLALVRQIRELARDTEGMDRRAGDPPPDSS